MNPKQPLPGSFQEHFNDLKDHRLARTRKYPLLQILFMAFSAILVGCKGWDEIAFFVKTKQTWFELWFELPHGTPCSDTFQRVFERLDPKAFSAAFEAWLLQLRKLLPGDILALDGKAIKGAFETSARTTPLHLLHVWATRQKVLLSQLAVDGAPGEIAGTQLLLQTLSVAGCVLIADANGCTQKNAAAIIDAKAGYVFGLKGNRGAIHKQTNKLFEKARELSSSAELTVITEAPGPVIKEHQEADKGHGRLEERATRVMKAEVLPEKMREKWKGLQTLVCIERRRTIGEKTSHETHYYLSSLAPNAERLGEAIRAYWSVENQLHYVLDVTMGEDECRVRNFTSAENLGTLRRQALGLLNHPESGKGSVVMKMRAAGWDDNYRTKLLCISAQMPKNQAP